MSIVEFQERHDRIHGPEPGHVIDIDGEKWYRYVCSFRHGTKTYSFDLWGLSMEHAQELLEAVKRGAELDGQVYARD